MKFNWAVALLISLALVMGTSGCSDDQTNMVVPTVSPALTISSNVMPSPTPMQTPEETGFPISADTSSPQVYIDALAIYLNALSKEDEVESTKMFNEAAEAFDKVIRMDDMNAKGEAWLFKGLVLGDLKRYEEALEAFDRAMNLVEADGSDNLMDIQSRYMFIWQGRAKALLELGRYDEAIESCNKAIEIDPKYEKLWFTMMRCYINKAESLSDEMSSGQQAWEEALGEAHRFLKIHTDSGGAALLGILAYKFLEDYSGKEWDRTYRYWGDDYTAHSVQQTSDGGYIVAGGTRSLDRDDADCLLIKTDANGEEQWEKRYGGSLDDEIAYSVEQTSDGGYILAGVTHSKDSEEGNSWLIKTDLNGKWQWDKELPGDVAYSVQQTSDGGYIVAGKTGGHSWLVKTDVNGKWQWNEWYHGDVAYSVQQTSDSGYIVAGVTHSYGSGGSDFWILKAATNGREEWSKTFGGRQDDNAYSVQQTSDGGYIVAGVTYSYGAGEGDFWLVKTDAQGEKEWSSTYGGVGVDIAHSAQQTTDGGYILVGETTSYGPSLYSRLSGTGVKDAWVVKTKGNGEEQWSRTFSNTADENVLNYVQRTSDNGYIMAGTASSETESDAWLIKLKQVDLKPLSLPE
jgi:tetratricopeptide (TPR) repeat protein